MKPDMVPNYNESEKAKLTFLLTVPAPALRFPISLAAGQVSASRDASLKDDALTALWDVPGCLGHPTQSLVLALGNTGTTGFTKTNCS